MECHLVVATQYPHPPLCTMTFGFWTGKDAKPCGYKNEYQARKARKALEAQGVHVMVRRGACPEAEKFDRERAAREKQASK